MSLFAIGDIHGRFDLLQKLLVKIEEASRSPNTIIFLGDYIDRGPQSRAVVETLIDGPMRQGDRWIALRGNHEQMMVDTYRKSDKSLWSNNGGDATLESFGGNVPAGILEWCAALPLCHQMPTHFFVHAGIRPGVSLDQQDAETMLWIRYRFLDDERDHGKHIVHGHSPNDVPELLWNRTNLDTRAFSSGRLTAGCFDRPGGPTSIVQVCA